MSAQTSQPDGALSGAEAMVRMLQAHQVEYLFGLCGDTTLPFYDALHRLDHGIPRLGRLYILPIVLPILVSDNLLLLGPWYGD